MTAIIGHIIDLFEGFNGVFVREHEYIDDPELLEFEETHLSNMEMTHCSSDQAQVKNDMQVIMSDLKTVIRKKTESMSK